jgi:hypothetical protein
MLTAEELLAGSSITYQIEVPPAILNPSEANGRGPGKHVRLRPLTVRDLQVVTRAAKESDALIATLMVQRALVEPELTVAQVASMHSGLVQFLLDRVNQISGITSSAADLKGSLEAPIVTASFVLSREFGWTPQQVSEMTLAQVLLHLQMLKEKLQP